MSELTTITVKLVPDAERALSRSVQREELNRTDIINRAVRLYDTIMEEVVSSGETTLRMGNTRWDIRGVV